jgi:RNA recognition motif-containing protein
LCQNTQRMTVFLSMIPIKWKEKDILALAEVFGEVGEIKIPIDRITRQSRGYAFVNFVNDADAKAFIQSIHGTEYDERRIVAEVSVPKPPKPAVNKTRSTPKSGKTADWGKSKKQLPPWLRKEY